MAAEAAVAAERARRRAASPRAKPPPQGPTPDSPMHPFAAAAAQNAAREAVATVTLSGGKRRSVSPDECPPPNPFAAAAGSRAMPRRVSVAEAGGFGSVSASDAPQVQLPACFSFVKTYSSGHIVDMALLRQSVSRRRAMTIRVCTAMSRTLSLRSSQSACISRNPSKPHTSCIAAK